MNLLTPTGYKNINDVNIGDELIAYDIITGNIILNHLEGKYLWTHNMLPPIAEEGYYDENGNWIITQSAQTSEQVFDNTYGEWKFYKINNSWTLFHSQSIWANMNITNASLLQIGDIMYDGSNNDVVITSIEEVYLTEWWRLEVSGDSSYISEDLTLHNASRYWVGGGSSTNWNATANTNWSGSSGGANNASVPTSVDDVLFDAAGNSSSVISATITILSINISSGYTATITHDAILTIAGNVTLGANYTIAGTSSITISAASTITSNGKTFPNSVQFLNTNTKTLVGNFTILGSLLSQAVATLNNNQLFCNGLNLNAGGVTINGTTEIVLTGGILTGSTSTTIQNNLTFNGTITVASGYNFAYGASGVTLKNLGGGVVTTNSNNITFINSITLDTSPISWGNITTDTVSGRTYTINSLFICNTITLQNTTTTTFAGSAGFETNNLTHIGTTTNTVIFKDGITYTINSAITANTTRTGAILNINSSSATLKSIILLKNGATCNLLANLTRIDASGGRTIMTWNGNVTDCINVNRYTDLLTVSKSFV